MTDNARRIDVIRLGIIGTGLAVEKLHWPALKRMSDRYQVIAFADISREHAEHFSDYSGTSMDGFASDYHEVLQRDDVDAVLISLPIPLNYPVTREALEAGKHVICEKPTGANTDENTAFAELEGKFPNQTVLIAENWFYRDDLRLARSLLDELIIGQIHLVSWRTVSQLVPREGEFSSTPWRQEGHYMGGPHLDGGVHNIAQLRLLCGDAARIVGEMQDANSLFGGPSDLTLNVRFMSGAVGNLIASHPEMAVPKESNDLRLYGNEGVMSVGREGIRVFRPDGTVETWQVTQRDAGYYNEFLNFHEALNGKAPLVGTIAQSVRNMEWITRGVTSAERGQVMKMSPRPTMLTANAVPLWRPAGAEGLFDGLDVTVQHDRTTA